MANIRKSPRAKWLDYDGGTFFVTICAREMAHFFGHIDGEEMALSAVGEIVRDELENPERHYPYISIPLYVIMPNHIHAIVVVNDGGRLDPLAPAEQRCPNPAMRGADGVERYMPRLTRYVGGFKSAVTRRARLISPDFGWLARYHDHFIRGTQDLRLIAEYIINNPRNWSKDRFASTK